MATIKILRNLHYSEWRRLHPMIESRYYAPPKYNQRTANGLTKCIVDFLNLSGYQAERISSEGKVIDKRKTYTDVIGRAVTVGGIHRTYSTTTNGTADISATINGRSVKIEVKVGKDRQSDAQKRHQDVIERAGGIYYIARNFESFYDWFIETFKSTEGLKYG